MQERFRLSRTAVERLVQDIGGALKRETNRGHPLFPDQQILLALRFFATGAHYNVIGDAHGVHLSTVCRAVIAVTNALVLHKFDSVIAFPSNHEKMVHEFYNIAHMPCCIGCIDGVHIPIMPPKLWENQFINRKGFHSINAMMICDPERRFIFVSARWPGSVADARVLRNSCISQHLDTGWRPHLRGFLLGDSGYPLKSWILTPVIKPNLTNAEQLYNQAHSKTRVRVEQAFGILKARFRCLMIPLRLEPVIACKVIKACCILHNICKEQDDDSEECAIDEGIEETPEEDDAGKARRAEIIAHFASLLSSECMHLFLIKLSLWAQNF